MIAVNHAVASRIMCVPTHSTIRFSLARRRIHQLLLENKIYIPAVLIWLAKAMSGHVYVNRMLNRRKRKEDIICAFHRLIAIENTSSTSTNGEHYKTLAKQFKISQKYIKEAVMQWQPTVKLTEL